MILVLERGRLVDQGTHEELAVRCETYREFLHTEGAKAHLGALAGAQGAQGEGAHGSRA